MERLCDHKFIELLREISDRSEGGFGEQFLEATAKYVAERELIDQLAKELERRDRIIKDQEAEVEHLKQVLRDNGVYSYMNRYGRAVWN